MLNKLRSKINGLLLCHDVRYQVSAYADDVMIMVNGQQDISILDLLLKNSEWYQLLR